jgi:hypothetical protein
MNQAISKKTCQRLDFIIRPKTESHSQKANTRYVRRRLVLPESYSSTFFKASSGSDIFEEGSIINYWLGTGA